MALFEINFIITAAAAESKGHRSCNESVMTGKFNFCTQRENQLLHIRKLLVVRKLRAKPEERARARIKESERARKTFILPSEK
jgi:hypothetical protein